MKLRLKLSSTFSPQKSVGLNEYKKGAQNNLAESNEYVKIFERVVFIQWYAYFDTNFFSSSEYGFRKGHSTEMACPEFIDQIVINLDNGKHQYQYSLTYQRLNHAEHNMYIPWQK